MRTVPGSGRLIVNGSDANLARVLAMGCWSGVEHFARSALDVTGERPAWSAQLDSAGDGSRFSVCLNGKVGGEVHWPLIGLHNVENALAAIGAARHAGVPPGTRL